jgi:hypothetical protein
VAVEMRFKHALGCRRPVEYSPQIQPIITTPLHGTYPMGHAVQAYLCAGLLQWLGGWDDNHPRTVQLQRLAARISINRVIAGVHFPVDASAGQAMAQTLLGYFLARCQAAKAPALKARSFGGEFYDPKPTPKEIEKLAKTQDFDGVLIAGGKKLKTPTQSTLLAFVTKQALNEWPDR